MASSRTYGMGPVLAVAVTKRELRPDPQAPAFPENVRSKSADTTKREPDVHSAGVTETTRPAVRTGTSSEDPGC